MKKKILSVVMSVVLGLSLVACGSKGENAKTDSLPEVTLGTSMWPTNMFFYLAKEKGFFEESGVKVNIQEFSSTTESTNAFVGGKLDFVTFASSETISPFIQDGNFKIVLLGLITDRIFAFAIKKMFPWAE